MGRWRKRRNVGVMEEEGRGSGEGGKWGGGGEREMGVIEEEGRGSGG